MAIKKSDFNKELNLLMSAQNEEEVLSILLKIIKIYNLSEAFYLYYGRNLLIRYSGFFF